MLGPLADNGGPTQTHALLPGSPAIDIGFNIGGEEFDQRGEPFSRVSGGRIDMGAFEFQSGAGDANRDGRFDVFDLLQIIVAGKFNTGEPAVWEEGDWNGDGFFDIFDILLEIKQGSFNSGADSTAAVLADTSSDIDRYHELQENSIEGETSKVSRLSL